VLQKFGRHPSTKMIFIQSSLYYVRIKLNWVVILPGPQRLYGPKITNFDYNTSALREKRIFRGSAKFLNQTLLSSYSSSIRLLQILTASNVIVSVVECSVEDFEVIPARKCHCHVTLGTIL